METTQQQGVDVSQEPIANEAGGEGVTPDAGTQNEPGSAVEQLEGQQGNEGEGTEGEGKKEDDIETIKNDEGEEFVPKKAFLARVAKLTSQRHEETDKASEAQSQAAKTSQLLNEIRSNPETRRQFAEAVAPEAPKAPRENKFQTYMATVPQNQRESVQGLSTAIISEVASFISDKLDGMTKQIEPLRTALGKSAVDQFYATVKDAKQYEDKIADMMETGRAKNIADAYTLASHGDQFSKGKAVGGKDANLRNQKLGKTPVTGPGTSTSKSLRSGSMSLDDGIDDALKQKR